MINFLIYGVLFPLMVVLGVWFLKTIRRHNLPMPCLLDILDSLYAKKPIRVIRTDTGINALWLFWSLSYERRGNEIPIEIISISGSSVESDGPTTLIFINDELIKFNNFPDISEILDTNHQIAAHKLLEIGRKACRGLSFI